MLNKTILSTPRSEIQVLCEGDRYRLNERVQPEDKSNVRVFQEEIMEKQDSSVHNALRLAESLGPRFDEFCAFRWRDFDFESGCLHFKKTIVRHEGNAAEFVSAEESEGEDRNLYLSEELRQIIMDQYAGFRKRFGTVPKQGDLIFCDQNGGNLDPAMLSRHYQKVVQLGNK